MPMVTHAILMEVICDFVSLDMPLKGLQKNPADPHVVIISADQGPSVSLQPNMGSRPKLSCIIIVFYTNRVKHRPST